MEFLHTMVRVSDVEASLRFYCEGLGLKEIRRTDSEQGRFTLIFLAIHRPPRDGRMAFVKSPDGISVELLQAGDALPKQEPWASMDNSGSW